MDREKILALLSDAYSIIHTVRDGTVYDEYDWNEDVRQWVNRYAAFLCTVPAQPKELKDK